MAAVRVGNRVCFALTLQFALITWRSFFHPDLSQSAVDVVLVGVGRRAWGNGGSQKGGNRDLLDVRQQVPHA